MDQTLLVLGTLKMESHLEFSGIKNTFGAPKM